METYEKLAKKRFEGNRAKAPHRLRIVSWEHQSQAVKDLWIDEQKEIAKSSSGYTKSQSGLEMLRREMINTIYGSSCI